MNLSRETPNDSALGTSLTGFIESLKKRLLNTNPARPKAEAILMQHNDKNAALSQLQQNKEKDSRGHVTYPFALVSLSDGDLSESAPSAVKMSRTGSGKAILSEGDNATMYRLYLYPATVNVEVIILTDDFLYALELFETHLLQAKRRAYSFPLSYKGVDDWTVTVKAQSMSFPKSDQNSEQIAGVYELTFTAEISTKVGIVKEVAKINNWGETTKTYGIKDEEENAIMIETSHNTQPNLRKQAQQSFKDRNK